MSMSPTQREKADTKRLNARMAKRNLSPGPAHYSPQRATSTSRDLAGHAAFRSGIERTSSHLLKDKGDPGSYDAHVYLSLVRQALSSFAKSQKDGKGGFGTQSERVLEFNNEAWNEGEKTPGPAAYEPQLQPSGKNHGMDLGNIAAAKQSPAFASKAPQRGESLLPNAPNPGPGRYAPNFESVEASLPDNPIAKTARDHRFTGDSIIKDTTTSAEVGPGSYESQHFGTIHKEMSDALELSSKVQRAAGPGQVTLGFTGRYAQHELPHQLHNKRESTPGPGAYEPRMTEKGTVANLHDQVDGQLTLSSGFKPGKIATELERDQTGDPGRYDPHENRSIEHFAKSSSNVTAKAGKLRFGAATARQIKIPPDMNRRGVQDQVTPGPAAYRPLSFRQFITHPLSSFRSLVPQRGRSVLPSADNPGPGRYAPNFESVEASLPDNPIAKTARDHRFTGDSIIKDTTTSAEVGPGSYESHFLGTIAEGSASALKRAGQYSSAHATSEKLGFSSTAQQHQLPHELANRANTALQRVGPGAYTPLVTEKGSVHAVAQTARDSFAVANQAGRGHFGTSADARGEKGTYNPQKEQGDPGAYNPHQNRDLAQTARASFQTSNAQGNGGFGSTLKRELPLRGDYNGHHGVPGFGADPANPGPAAYEPLLTDQGKNFNMEVSNIAAAKQSPAFASKAPQRGDFLLPNAPNPGPGCYDPNFESVEASLPDNPIAKTARDHRFTGDSIIKDSETGPDVGPSSYHPGVTNNGHLESMGARAAEKASWGWSASFLSTHIREMWQGWFGDNDELNSA